MGMRRDTTRTSEDLDRPDGNSLLENYDVHDMGEKYIIQQLEFDGFRVESWGMDKRHDNDGLLFEDNKVDLKVYDGDVLVCLLEVKTKTSHRYMGSMNERHYIKYRKIANTHNVPTFVGFFEFPRNSDKPESQFFVPMDVGGSQDVISGKFQFPDGNAGVRVSNFYQWSFYTFMEHLFEQLE